MTTTNEFLCTIAFQAEAYDSAADAYRRLTGWTVEVFPAEGEPFTATVGEITVDEDGQYHVLLYKWDAEHSMPGTEFVSLDIYNDIDRVEVV